MSELPSQTLAPDEVHVWHLAADRFVDAGRLEQFEKMLSADEVARHRRFIPVKSRHEFLRAHGFLRTVLAAYTGIPPAVLIFATTGTGKPTLQLPSPAPPLHFNLSHSHGSVACALSASWPVGVDIEDARRVVEYLELAQRYFAPLEVAHLRSLRGEDVRRAFFAIWTLKEAFVKAIGQGLSFPLESFAFELEGDRLVQFYPPASLPGRTWQAFQFAPSPEHQGALIVECPPGSSVRLTIMSPP